MGNYRSHGADWIIGCFEKPFKKLSFRVKSSSRSLGTTKKRRVALSCDSRCRFQVHSRCKQSLLVSSSALL